MASRHEKELRAEAEARQAASDRAWTEPDPEEPPGVIGSVLKAVQSAKEAVVGKSRDEQHGRRDEAADYYAGDGGDKSREETMESAKGALDEKAREAAERAREAKERGKERTGEMTKKAIEAAGDMKDYTAEKAREGTERARGVTGRSKERSGEMMEKVKEAAGETKDYTAEKAREAAEKTRETAESAKEKSKMKTEETKEKTKQTAQSAADKTKETTQSATSKLGELRDKAMGLFSVKKEEAKEKTHETAETAKEKLQETEEETRRRMEELRLKGRDEYEGDVARRVREDKDESERGKEERGGGLLGTLGALKEKLTPHPSDSNKSRPVDEGETMKEPRRTGEEKAQVVEVVMEDMTRGAVESAQKASNQATGQTFNDVGRIDDEGVVRIVHLNRDGKK